MSVWTNLTGDARQVGYGCRIQVVKPGKSFQCRDDFDECYAIQTTMWGPGDDNAKAVVARLAAAAEPIPESEPEPEPEEAPAAPAEAPAAVSPAAVLAQDQAAIAAAQEKLAADAAKAIQTP